MLRHKASSILRIVLIIEVVALLTNAAALFRDYQDSWVLEGLEIPFMILAITYVVYVFKEDRIGWLILFALVFRAVFLLIPNLKYFWFQGVGIDQHQHYGLMHDIYTQGYIRTGATFERIFEYSGTPLMHLTTAIFSRVTLISPLDAFKYLPSLLWLLFPSMVYVVMAREPSAGKSHMMTKYAVIISSIPFGRETSYMVTGTTIGLLLVFMYLSQFTKVLRATDGRNWLVVALLGFGLVAAHSYSSMIMMVGLIATYLIYRAVRKRQMPRLAALSPNVLLLLIVTNIVWLLYGARRLFDQLMVILSIFVNTLLGSTTVHPALTGIYPRFFDLNVIDQFRIILLFYGAILFLLLLTLGGIIVAVKRYRHSSSFMFLSFYVIGLWAFIIVQVVAGQSRAGLLEFIRIPIHTLALSPILGGLLLYHLNRNMRRTALVVLTIAALVTLSTIELYGPPQLIPSANTINKNLPATVPLVYVNDVNSVYQRYLIKHAERFIRNGTVVSDSVTRLQFWGLADYSFIANYLSDYYPLSRLIDQSIPRIQFEYFLVHLPGKSGAFQEKAEIRTESIIADYICNSSIVYTNGESFVTTKPFTDFP